MLYVVVVVCQRFSFPAHILGQERFRAHAQQAKRIFLELVIELFANSARRVTTGGALYHTTYRVR